MARILVTDDNALTRNILRAILEMEGHEVVEADGGKACLDSVQRARPDLLILDLRMPGMDGWETAAALRADPANKDIPIMALTADTRPESMREAESAGCDRYLTKPINHDVLVGALSEMLNES